MSRSETISGTERILDWDGTLNARDTGGMRTGDGRRVRPGALVRSDILTRLTPDGRAALIAHGVRTIVDVRTPAELAADDGSYPFADDDPDVRHVNVPYTGSRTDDQWVALRARYESARDREELNRIDLQEHADGLAAIAAAVADAGPGGVLIHCHAGKDRTGMSVAVILSLAGVSDEEIADDYALTALNLEPLIIDWLDEMSHDPAERARLRVLAAPRREAMLDTLRTLREQYGGAERFLLAAGLSHSQVARLRTRLIEDREDD